MNKLTHRDYEKLKDIMKLQLLLGVESHLRSDEDNLEIRKLTPVLQIFSFFENTESLELISKRLDLKKLHEGQTLFSHDFEKQYIYVVLIGHIDVFEELHNDITNTYMEKRIRFFKQGASFSYDLLQDVRKLATVVPNPEDRGQGQRRLGLGLPLQVAVRVPAEGTDSPYVQHSHDTSVAFIMKFLR